MSYAEAMSRPRSCPEHIVQMGLADRQLLPVPVNYTVLPTVFVNYIGSAAMGPSENKKGPDFHQDRFCGAEGARTLDLRRDRPAF